MKLETIANLIIAILLTIATTIYFTLAIVYNFRVIAICSIGAFLLIPTIAAIACTIDSIIKG